MITTEQSLKDLGFKYLFDYGIKPNHYEIYKLNNVGYFFERTSDGLLEEVKGLNRIDLSPKYVDIDNLHHHVNNHHQLELLDDLMKQNLNNYLDQEPENLTDVLKILNSERK